MGDTGRNGPIACFKCPNPAPFASVPSIGHRERSVATCFIRGVFRNIWTFEPPVPSAEHRNLINKANAHLLHNHFWTAISDMFKSSTSFYRHLGRWSSTLVCCPECREPMTIRLFYSTHAPQKYNLDCRKQCLFCFGRKHWPYGQKNRPENVNHVTACLQRFVEDATINEKEDENETVEPEEEVCGCRHFQPVPRDMQGRRKDRLSEYVGFYDSLLEKPEMREEGIEFQGGLGKDVWGIVQRYLRADLMWFHIMVKHDMFDTFRKEMEKIRDQCVLLPFWCLCDGLVNEKGKTQHRHMIVVCEQESSFKDVWKGKIRYEFPNSGRAKKCVKIKSAFHLVRTILYVSQPKSSCDKDEIPDNWRNPVNLSHQSALAPTQFCLSLYSVSRGCRKITMGATGQ
ncbi:uncharacterized protein TNIN_345171 [Trichonephila inaurata madagascariensis]|uniref:Uncharacterized protein n=1 Tax=Trichonephila inaurata madagascariensis TaxID=2747483 RepID=A0A8X7CPC5_9ARAC|nr:uncharacterized protein TNIN_197531 [Trichonephila inaurata madagascariensis]GFY71227.1 uncharacterized protein TNIN_345171 [Trichonephila inaurata madagascariensis]